MPAKMLVRALKVLDLFHNGKIRTGIDTAALDQPGDEGCAYGRAAPDWQRLTRNPQPVCRPFIVRFATMKVIDGHFSQIDFVRRRHAFRTRCRTRKRRIL
jgi:hypothetical protein